MFYFVEKPNYKRDKFRVRLLIKLEKRERKNWPNYGNRAITTRIQPYFLPPPVFPRSGFPAHPIGGFILPRSKCIERLSWIIERSRTEEREGEMKKRIYRRNRKGKYCLPWRKICMESVLQMRNSPGKWEMQWLTVISRATRSIFSVTFEEKMWRWGKDGGEFSRKDARNNCKRQVLLC